MQVLSAFRFWAGPTEPSRVGHKWQQVVRLRHGPVVLVLAAGETGHAVRSRWDGGRWGENGVRRPAISAVPGCKAPDVANSQGSGVLERGIPSSSLPLYTRYFTPDCPYWNLERDGPLHYRASGRWGYAKVETLNAMWREATYPPSHLLSYAGADFNLLLRYWLPPGILILKALYTFNAPGAWIITQSAWEWRGV